MLTDRSTRTLVRVTLVLVFLAFGYVKFFPFEAEAVAPLIGAHPLLSGLAFFGQQGASIALGISEIATALLLASRPVAPRLSALGGAMGMATFFTTVTLFLFLPGVFEASAGGFPAISGTGGFLLKDTVLFAASYLCLVDSLEGMKRMKQSRPPQLATA
jgi:reactive chlorine resistance protein C